MAGVDGRRLTLGRRGRWIGLAALAIGLLAPAAEAQLAVAAPPLAETAGAPVRTTTTAQLNGRVDPNGAATTFLFEYGDSGPCGPNPCAATASQSAGSDDLTVLVAKTLNGLEPSTTYHYRLVANNGDPAGPSFGADMTVTTRASEAALTHGHFPGPPGSDRAWEQVSPADTGGNPVNEAMGFSDNGERAIVAVAGGTPESDTGNLYSVFFSERTPAGWKQRTLLPPRGNLPGPPHWFIVPDANLSRIAGSNLNEANGRTEIWGLEPDKTAVKLFANPRPTFFLENYGISDDGSRIVMLITGNVDPAHPSPVNGSNLYDLAPTGPRLIGLMPDGSVPACGATAVGVMVLGGRARHVISPDGSHVFFGSARDCGIERVYVRDLTTEETVLASPPPISGPECDAIFLSSAPDAAFFWTKNRLAADDTDPNDCEDPLDGDVYRYDLGTGAVECVTCVVIGQDADVYARFVNRWFPEESILVSEDGSRIYFQSPNSLTPGAPEVDESGSIYRVNVDTGALAWVGPSIRSGAGSLIATPSGAALLFFSNSPVLSPVGGVDSAATVQLYRYDDRDRSLICISCPRDGSSPLPLALPEATARGYSAMSADGNTIAFITSMGLIDEDQNTSDPLQNPEGGRDVYEWRDGRLLLVSDGLINTTRGNEGPSISAVSPSGRDIFFIAQAQYTPDALDTYRRLFDARIGGGIEFPKPPPPCPLEVCQGTPKGVPEEAAPGTASFAGFGNVRDQHYGKRKKAKKAKKKAKANRKRSKKRQHRQQPGGRVVR